MNRRALKRILSMRSRKASPKIGAPIRPHDHRKWRDPLRAGTHELTVLWHEHDRLNRKDEQPARRGRDTAHAQRLGAPYAHMRINKDRELGYLTAG